MDGSGRALRNLETVAGLAVALLAIAHLTATPALRVVAVALLVVGLWRPGAAAIARPWLAAAAVLGRVNGWLLLCATFLLVLTPVALLRRALGQGHRAFRAAGAPAWVVREHRWGADDLGRPG